MSKVMEQSKGQRDKSRDVGAQQCIYVINGNQITAKIYMETAAVFFNYIVAY